MTREEAIEIIRDTPIDLRSTREDDIHTLYATAQMMAIDALSERPKGRWIGEVIHTEIGEEHAMQECSVCGKVRIVDNFCPNCGADMRGEEE